MQAEPAAVMHLDDMRASTMAQNGEITDIDSILGLAPPSPTKEKKKLSPWFQWTGANTWRGRPMTMRMKIFETFEDPGYSNLAKIISIFMMLLILLVTVCYVLESETLCFLEDGTRVSDPADLTPAQQLQLANASLPSPCIDQGLLWGTTAFSAFKDIEFVAVIIFTVEYVVRICSCPCKNRGLLWFVLDPNNLIDILAILPFWVIYVVRMINPDSDGAGFGFVRVIRLVRVFRVFRMGKYSVGIQLFSGAMVRSSQSMSILLLLLTLAVVIISSITYMFEEAVSTQAGCFETIGRTFWWALVTMTTVGYGDCSPVSAGGKLIASVAMLLGVLILALPITVVGSNFQKMVEMYEEELQSLKEVEAIDADGDGKIDEMELREFLTIKKKEGTLRRDVGNVNALALLAKFDKDDKGWLDVDEFRKLKDVVIDKDALDPATNMRTLLKRTAEQERINASLQEHLDRVEQKLDRLLAMGPSAHATAPPSERAPVEVVAKIQRGSSTKS